MVGRTGGTDAYGVNGTMTLSLLSITNPQSPTLLGTTLITQGQFPTATGSSHNKISALPLGNGLFAVSEATVNGNPELMLVDPGDPNNILVTYTPVPALVNEMAVSGSLLYTSSTQGLTIYNIGTFQGIPLSVSVEVPTAGAVDRGRLLQHRRRHRSPRAQPTTRSSGTRRFTYGDPTFPITWQSTVGTLTVGRSRARDARRFGHFHLRRHARHVPDARYVGYRRIDHQHSARVADRAARRDRDLRRATHEPDEQLGDLLTVLA